MKKQYVEPEFEYVEFQQKEAISLDSNAFNEDELDW